MQYLEEGLHYGILDFTVLQQIVAMWGKNPANHACYPYNVRMAVNRIAVQRIDEYQIFSVDSLLARPFDVPLMQIHVIIILNCRARA